MSQENFEQFKQLVLQDTALQQQLRSISDRDQMVALTQRLGAERGYSFTTEDVWAALHASQREWIERWLQR
ncbi:MAG TPA: Nif11-like leader peptide family natural product precursor [Pyrinomonadaceae bacterium]|nr:Nif11-like leader peptide family natural product precursor [Pyrinomonadaceae bacterium]